MDLDKELQVWREMREEKLIFDYLLRKNIWEKKTNMKTWEGFGAVHLEVL